MFCLPVQDHHHSHRILRSFRSHKSLRAEAQAVPEMPHLRHHQRHPSVASSAARSSSDSSRPSTSRTDASLEWDPLRLHPVGPNPVPVLDDIKRQELRHARSLHSLRQQHLKTAASHSHSHSHSEPAMVIYDGFDFGFASPRMTSSAPSSPTTSSGCVTPRPHLVTDDDYFKRGDWKRRGIVFGTSEATMATEEECFDLEVEI